MYIRHVRAESHIAHTHDEAYISLSAVLRTRLNIRVLATKPLRYIYRARRGRHVNTKHIPVLTNVIFVPCAFCRSVTPPHLEISYGDLNKIGLTNKGVRRILGKQSRKRLYANAINS